MLGVAQLAERQAVDLLVGGSNPLAQPTLKDAIWGRFRMRYI